MRVLFRNARRISLYNRAYYCLPFKRTLTKSPNLLRHRPWPIQHGSRSLMKANGPASKFEPYDRGCYYGGRNFRKLTPHHHRRHVLIRQKSIPTLILARRGK